MQKIITALNILGFPITAPLFDGLFHHYGDKKKIWFIGTTHTLNNKTFYKASFGDVRVSSSYHETDWSEPPTPEEEVEVARIIAELEAEKKAVKESQWEEKAKFATQLFNDCPSEFIPTKYSERKGIRSAYGARNYSHSGIGSKILAVALRDIDGSIRNIQSIFDEKNGDGNNKLFLEGAQIDGLFAVVNESNSTTLSSAAHLVLSEGWATAASIAAILKSANAEGVLSISCATAGNIGKVAEAIRTRFPNLLFTIAADNDSKKTNAGVNAAVKAAQRFGAKVVIPPAEDGITDWNDYLFKYGIDEAKRCFYSPTSEILDLAVPSTNTEKKKKLNDHQVATIVIQSFGNELIRESTNDYFGWVGTHWEHLHPEVFPLRVLQKLSQQAGSGKTSDMKAAWGHFHAFFPVTPRGLFDVVKWKANFINGTVEVNPESRKVFFHEHRKEDFMTTTIPFEVPLPYGEVTKELCREVFDKYPKNSLFLQYIENTFGECKMSDILQVYGAALIPSFPRIVMAIGNAGSGKSTMAKILIAFLDKKNISAVQPCLFKDFHLHPMVGKICNIVTELDLKAPIIDHIVKALIDQEPIEVNRKGINFISAILAPLQIWCGNDLPKSLDGASGAYERRLTILKTREEVKNLPQDDFFVINLIRESGAQILMGALMEFFTLLEQGGFKQTEESLQLVKDFQSGSNIIGQFISDLTQGNFSTANNDFGKLNGSGFIPSQILYNVYVEWVKANGRNHLSQFEFTRQMKREGFEKIKKRAGGQGRNENAIWGFDISVTQAEGSFI